MGPVICTWFSIFYLSELSRKDFLFNSQIVGKIFPTKMSHKFHFFFIVQRTNAANTIISGKVMQMICMLVHRFQSQCVLSANYLSKLPE